MKHLMILATSLVFAGVIVQYSHWHGKLIYPPVYDDVEYLVYSMERYAVLHEAGPLALLADYSRNPPLLAPVTTYLAVGALALLGPDLWVCYFSNALVIAFFLWITARFTRRAGNMTTVVCAAAALAFPICAVSIYNFLPDPMCGLMVAFCILETIRHPLVRAPWRYQLLLGLGWAMALMLKPSVSPATMLFLCSSVGLAVVRDLNLAPRRQLARAIKAGAIVIGVAVGLSGVAYFSLALGQHLSRWRVGNLTSYGSMWRYGGSMLQHALYYVTGNSGSYVLGVHLYLIGAILVAGTVTVLLRHRGKRVRWACGSAMTMVFITYAAYTLVPNKSLVAAMSFQWLLVLLFIIGVRVLLMHWRGIRANTFALALLVSSLGLFHWPAPAHSRESAEARGARQLGEDVYQALRSYPNIGERTVYLSTNAAVNAPGLRLLALRDRSPLAQTRFACLLEDDLQLHKKVMGDADLIFATASGSRLQEYYTPATAIQNKLLDLARQDPNFKELRRFPTPGGPYFYLLDRKDMRKVVPRVIPKPGPVILSLEPRDGKGRTATMTVRVKPLGQVQNLNGIMVSLATPTGSRRCMLCYIPSTGGILLASDTPGEYLPLVRLGWGAQGSRHCSINGARSNAWTDGTSHYLRFTLGFTDAIQGQHKVLVYADGTDGGATNWTPMGQWTVSP